ncbi:hypothetical protein QE152_g1033 [Popillia japonica]|uniref:Uncharacterized protein n=1 Tax=Popillia japonica TaxID=7064 RepID=A0AAW1NCN2_POPJA
MSVCHVTAFFCRKMAEDFDVEAMLEAPYKKDTYEVNFGLSSPSSIANRVAVDDHDPMVSRPVTTSIHPNW